MLSTEDSTNLTLVLTDAYHGLMYMLSTEDSTNATLMLTVVYQCLMYMLSILKIAHM